MKELIKKIIYKIRDNREKKAYLNSIPNTFGLSKSMVKKIHSMGFTADEYVIYNLEHKDPTDYLSEWERMLYRKHASKWAEVFDNKIIFSVLAKHIIPVSKIFAYKNKGFFVGLDISCEKPKDIIDCIKREKKIVLKSTSLGGGDGFHLLEYKENQFFDNRIKTTEIDMMNLLNTSDSYLIEEFCVQSDFENQLFPYSVNTLRLITMLLDNQIQLTYAYHRMGGNKEATVDNLHKGGFFAEIDIETGKLSAATTTYSAKYTKNSSEGACLYSTHPVSGFRIEGTIVPNWEHIVENVVNAHKKLLFTGSPLIAWDVALTNDGLCVIEANTSCGLDIIQRYEGHRNKTMGRFFREQGVIK